MMENDKLLRSCEQGDLASFDRALTSDVDLEARDALGRTALMTATQKNHKEMVAKLIAAGSDVNARDITQLTPFICAAANGFDELIPLMVEGGAKLASVNRFGGTALLPSSEKGYLKTVELCIGAGVPVNHVNDLGWSALLEAVILGDGGYLYTDVIRALVSAGADPHIQDRDGVSSLQHAKTKKQSRVVSVFENNPVVQNDAILQAKLLASESRLSEALNGIEKALQDNTHDTQELLYYKGYFLQLMKRFPEAIDVYNQALQSEQPELQFHFCTANCYRLQKQQDLALAEFDKAIALAPTDTFFMYHKSNYLREFGRHEEAVDVMNQLLMLEPKRYDFSFHKANSLRSLDRHQEAIDAIENAIANDPTNPLYTTHKEKSMELLR